MMNKFLRIYHNSISVNNKKTSGFSNNYSLFVRIDDFNYFSSQIIVENPKSHENPSSTLPYHDRIKPVY